MIKACELSLLFLLIHFCANFLFCEKTENNSRYISVGNVCLRAVFIPCTVESLFENGCVNTVSVAIYISIRPFCKYKNLQLVIKCEIRIESVVVKNVAYILLIIYQRISLLETFYIDTAKPEIELLGCIVFHLFFLSKLINIFYPRSGLFVSCIQDSRLAEWPDYQVPCF